MIEPECFYTRFGEEWEVMEKCDRNKGYELRVVLTWRKINKICLFQFLLASLHFLI